MKSNILINYLVLFYNAGIFPSDLLTFFILIDLMLILKFLQRNPIFCIVKLYDKVNFIQKLFFVQLI